MKLYKHILRYINLMNHLKDTFFLESWITDTAGLTKKMRARLMGKVFLRRAIFKKREMAQIAKKKAAL